MKDKAITKVKFLIHPEDSEVFAYFPEEFYDGIYDDQMRTCYAHIGQHSACHPDYAMQCRDATPEEYQELKHELEEVVGYKLKILNK